jgi:amino acid transporter
LYWVGIGIAVLLSLAVYFFGFFGSYTTLQAVEYMFSTIFLLTGLWTLVSAFAIVEANDRTFYSLWGIVFACVSLFAYVPPNFAIGILLIALVVLIILVYFTGRTQKEFTTATKPPQPAGDLPAAI